MSEFGKGFTYCLALFIAHQHLHDEIKKSHAGLWFSGSSDHLYELSIPDNFVLKDECQEWRDTMLTYGHGISLLEKRNLTEKDIISALEKAKEFLRAWDKQCGIAVEKGEWE